jgi:hypothetical protein
MMTKRNVDGKKRKAKDGNWPGIYTTGRGRKRARRREASETGRNGVAGERWVAGSEIGGYNLNDSSLRSRASSLFVATRASPACVEIGILDSLDEIPSSKVRSRSC